MSESVILCEGFYDRAFWAGWLIHLACPAPKAGARVLDPSGKLVERGHYGFYTVNGHFVRVVPCHGKDKILPEARHRLRERWVDPFSRLVMCVDPDVIADGAEAKTGLRTNDVLRIIRELVPDAETTADGDIELDEPATKVSLVRWEAGDNAIPGIPARQCLERLVCAAMVAAYPDRGAAVQDWLDRRPDAPDSIPKEFAWSHMAGWYADRGCDNFFHAVWEDERIVVHLIKYLKASGAWRIGEVLVA